MTTHPQLGPTVAHGATVLLAEDNPVNQRIAVAMLTSLGCEVHVVDNGREAVAAADGVDFDLILMDCQMPVMDGFEATEAIRAAEADDAGTTRRTPILAMSASAMLHDQRRCSEAGMDGHLAKPLRTDQLAAVILRAMPTRDDDQSVAASISLRLAELFDGLDGDVVGDSVDLMRSFQRRAAGAIVAIERALATDDAPATRQHAHSLKGMAGNIGATRLAQDAAEVEDAARDGRMPVSTSMIAELQLGLAAVERAVTQLFPSAS